MKQFPEEEKEILSKLLSRKKVMWFLPIIGFFLFNTEYEDFVKDNKLYVIRKKDQIPGVEYIRKIEYFGTYYRTTAIENVAIKRNRRIKILAIYTLLIGLIIYLLMCLIINIDAILNLRNVKKEINK